MYGQTFENVETLWPCHRAIYYLKQRPPHCKLWVYQNLNLVMIPETCRQINLI